MVRKCQPIPVDYQLQAPVCDPKTYVRIICVQADAELQEERESKGEKKNQV